MIYKGKILTVNQNDDVFSYLVERDGIIEYVGDVLPEGCKDDQVVELGRRVLIPTFADTHQHFASYSLFSSGLNVMEADSNETILEMIRDYYQRSDEKSLLAFGASPYSVKEKRLITREELDEVCPDKPFFMVKYDGHACVVNTVLLKKLKDQLEGLRGYHPDSGEMNQEAFFAVSDYISNSVSIPKLIGYMKDALDHEASKGIGMIHTVSGVGFPLNMDITMETFFAKYLSNGLQVRVFPQSMRTFTATSRGLKRIGGCFKCALDGCFGSRDAALNEPYMNNSLDKGVLYYTDEEVIDFCKKANRKGLQIEMHAIGDRAFDQACKALKAALDDHPRADHRHGIIHCCLPTKEGIEICKDYHIQIPMQIAFDNWKQEPQEYTELILGKERNALLNPVRDFMDAGCVVSFGSDAPCTDPDPIVWLYKAVNHSNRKQAVDIRDALRMCTYNGYWTTFDEDKRGSLEKGKIADMVILSDDPYTMNKKDLMSLRVEKTIIGGKEYTRR